MSEFYCGGVILVVLVFYSWKPRKILALLRVEAISRRMPIVLQTFTYSAVEIRDQ